MEINQLEEDKLILDYMENPRLLWEHLKVHLKNSFFERYVVQNQLLDVFQKNQEYTFRDCVKEIRIKNRNSEFIKVIDKKLKNFGEIDYHDLPSFKIHFKNILKQIFQIWLL